MSSGPPPSHASSSKNKINSENTTLGHEHKFHATMSNGVHAAGTSTSQPPHSPETSGHLNPYASLATSLNGPQTIQYPSYTNWQTSGWPVNPLYATYPAPGGVTQGVPTTSHYSQQSYTPYQMHSSGHSTNQLPTSNSDLTIHATTRPSTTNVENEDMLKQRQRPTSPPRRPPPKFEHWDEVVKQFLKDAGLTQALRGFACDMLVMNEDWERNEVAYALQRFVINLDSTREMKLRPFSQKGKSKMEIDDMLLAEMETDRALDERKLDYVHLDSVIDEKPRTPTSTNKEISVFLARSRARNDASNRAEFVFNIAEKRRRAQENGNSDGQQIPSCARVDAKTIDRDLQMKYDISKNGEGPLRRTRVKKEFTETSIPQATGSQGNTIGTIDEQSLLPKHHPGINDRLSNIETHLAVRYVPSPPKTLWARLKSLEDHIVRLEKDYPPWAALHFNQPNRGWPPPPRATPIIVPAHLRSTEDAEANKPTSGQASTPSPLGTMPVGLKTRNNKSSLHRAVLERLEVQQAMGEKATLDS